LVEFTVPHPDAGPVNRGVDPYEALKKYLAGDRTPNTPDKQKH
jgi:hypothetical protein